MNNKNIVNNSNVSKYENHAYVVIDPRNAGKTYHMLKLLEKIGNKRHIHIITRSPNQYPVYKTSTDIKPIHKYNGSVAIIDDMLGTINSSKIDEFFTRGWHEDLTVFHLSQIYFALARQSIRNKSDRLILFKQTLKEVQCMYYDIGAYDMIYDEFKIICHKTWSEKLNYLCIDMIKGRDGCIYRIFNESKTTYIECTLQNEPFQKHMVVIHTIYSDKSMKKHIHIILN